MSERDVAACFAPSPPPSVVLLSARIGLKADPAFDANVEGTSASATLFRVETTPPVQKVGQFLFRFRTMSGLARDVSGASKS